MIFLFVSSERSFYSYQRGNQEQDGREPEVHLVQNDEFWVGPPLLCTFPDFLFSKYILWSLGSNNPFMYMFHKKNWECFTAINYGMSCTWIGFKLFNTSLWPLHEYHSSIPPNRKLSLASHRELQPWFLMGGFWLVEHAKIPVQFNQRAVINLLRQMFKENGGIYLPWTMGPSHVNLTGLRRKWITGQWVDLKPSCKLVQLQSKYSLF